MQFKSFPTALFLAAALTSAPVVFAQQAAPDAQTPAQAPAYQAPADQAQPAPRHAPNPHRQAVRLSRQLGLTPDQASRIEPILADRDQKLASLRANSTLAPADLHRQMHAIQKDTRSQLAGVLTPDQMQQLQQIQRSHKAKSAPQQQQPPAPAA